MSQTLFLTYVSVLFVGIFAGLDSFFGLHALAGSSDRFTSFFIVLYIGYLYSNIFWYVLGRLSSRHVSKVLSFFKIKQESVEKARHLLKGKNFFFFSLIIPFLLDSVIYFTCGLIRMSAWKLVPIVIFTNMLYALMVTFFGKETYSVLLKITSHPSLASFFMMTIITLLLIRSSMKKR